MPDESPKTANLTTISCTREMKAVILELQRRYMKKYGAPISQDRILDAMASKGFTVADLPAPELAATKAA
jgi:hypothetical protein